MDQEDDRITRFSLYRTFVCLVLVSILGVHVYGFFLSTSFGEPFNNDLAEVKDVFTKLTRELNELNVKQQQLHSEMERVMADLPPVYEKTENILSAFAPPQPRKPQHGGDQLNYDYKLTDFAMESAGGRVLDTGDTIEHIRYESAASWLLHAMAQMVCRGCNGADTILRPGSLPGECWSFRGQRAQATIQLAGYTHIAGFSLEHIAAHLSHTKEISSAPRRFTIEGLEKRSDPSPHIFGNYEYDSQGSPIQYFKASNTTKPYHLVRLRVNSNWGHPTYTCVYRLRVHGLLAAGQAPFPVQDTYKN